MKKTYIEPIVELLAMEESVALLTASTELSIEDGFISSGDEVGGRLEDVVFGGVQF